MTLLKDESVPTKDSIAATDSVVVNAVSQAATAAGFVQEKFQEAKTHRTIHEYRWINAFDQFRGNYSPEERAMLGQLKTKNPFASEAFIKITKTKTLAAYGSILDVLSYGNSVPFDLEPTPVPEGIADVVHVDPAKGPDSSVVEELAGAIGTKDTPLKPGTRLTDIMSNLGSTYSKLLKGKNVAVGNSPDKINAPEFYPAREAANKMRKHINDQLLEAHAQREIEGMVWEMCLYGTGVIKGPFNRMEMTKKWDHSSGKATFSPEYKRRPGIKNPSIWNIYPDPYASTSEDLDYVIEQHKLTRSELQKLKAQNNFNVEFIDQTLRSSPTTSPDNYEDRLRDTNNGTTDNRYEVLEYWGNCDVNFARSVGIEGIPEDLEDFEQIQVNIWAVNGLAIKSVINPFVPDRIPYRFVCFENIKYQIWGVGVPENMRDAQAMINTHTRAAQDNLRLAGSVMLEVNEAQLKPGQDNSIYAGKVWRKQGGAPGQSIYPININNTAPQHFQFINEANRWADQSSGIPSVMHGQTGISGTGRTATSLSMIMNGGSLSIRSIIKNIDRDFIKPIVEAFFDWNMQFNGDAPEIIGDVRIVASGVSALAQREVQSQRILSFLQIVSNPALSPHANIRYLLEELASSLDLNKERAINDIELTKLYMQLQQQGAPNGQGTNGPAQQPQQGGNPSPDGSVPPTGEADSAGLNGGDIGISPSPTAR